MIQHSGLLRLTSWLVFKLFFQDLQMAGDLFSCLLLDFLLRFGQTPHVLVKNHPKLLGRPVTEYVIDVKGNDFVATVSNVRGLERLICLLSSCARREFDECCREISWLISSRYKQALSYL